MTRFRYSGPLQTIALRVSAETAGETPDIVDTTFVPNGEVELDPNHAVTIALRDAGFLTEISDGDAVVTPPVDLAFADGRDGSQE